MISLIVATYGRVKELDRLFNSLRYQIYRDFEVIIVDQNEDGCLDEIINTYKYELQLQHIKSTVKGLSINRNIGIKRSKGSLIAFPDDDCYYSPTALEAIYNASVKNKGYYFFIMNAYDVHENDVCFKKATNNIIHTRKQVLESCISFNVFVRTANLPYFDESLGLGCYFGSGEETDLLFEILNNGYKGMSVSNAKVYHNDVRKNLTINKQYNYGLGFGALLKKDIIKRRHYASLLLYVYYLCRSLGGYILTHNKIYIKIFRSRLIGFIRFK
jgi:glycosyltransferase involved in cell wall biosynthesis